MKPNPGQLACLKLPIDPSLQQTYLHGDPVFRLRKLKPYLVLATVPYQYATGMKVMVLSDDGKVGWIDSTHLEALL